MALRVEFHSGLTHAKLDYPPFVADGDAPTILKFDYKHGIDKMGTFTLEVPADCAAAANAIAGRELWFFDGDFVVFKGVIRTREYAVGNDGGKVLTLVGPSITDQLNGTHTGRGLQFQESTLSAAITSLLTGTDFDAGTIDTATIPAREYNDRYLFDAVMATAQAVDCSVRENLLSATPTLDVGVFGEASGITLRNLPESSPSLSENPWMKQIGAVKVKAQSLDVRNRITPWGQIEGIGGLMFNLGYVSPGNTALTTRLYFGGATAGTPDISPTPDATWDNIANVSYYKASTERGVDGIALQGVTNAVGTANYDMLRYSHVYGPLGAQTLGGNVTGQWLAYETGADADAKSQLVIRVVAPDGTVRGTALAMGTYGTEFSVFATVQNRTFPSTALTPIEVTAGDYLVIERGVRFVGAVAGREAGFRNGDAGTADLPVDETTTDTTLNPWIEFSQYIALGAALPSGASYVVQSQTRNGRLEYYIEDTASQAIYGIREASPIFKDIFPLGLTNLDFGLASTTLYGLAVNYLQKHLEEQVAYEVDALALRHVNPSNGAAYFRPGDTMRLQFDGWTQNADGTRTDYLQVDRDLYVLDFTVTYDSAGTPVTKLTLSTFLRAERSDSEIIKQMAKELGISNVSPLSFFTIGDGAIRMDSTSIQLRTLGGDVVAIYGLDELSSDPDSNPSYWKLSGLADDSILANEVTLGLYTNGTARSRLFLGYGSFTQAALYAGATRSYYSANFNNATGNYLAPIIQPTLAGLNGSSYTLSGDAITLDVASYWLNGESAEHPGNILVDTEAAAATDNLATINGTGMRDGQLLVIRAANTAHTVVVKNGTGNIFLNGSDMSLDSFRDTITLMCDGAGAWLELARSNNGT